MQLVFLLCLVLFAGSSVASELTASFQPCPNVAVDVTVSKLSVDYAVAISGAERTKSVRLDIETQPHLELNDFNFDGLQDFAVWYLDEGMGKYTIHRVFIYDTKSNDFVEAAPRCGDEFLNLRVDKIKHKLISTYYINTRPKSCSTRLQKSGKAEQKRLSK